MPVMDVFDAGRMGIIQDPLGDIAASRAFYTAVFGWGLGESADRHPTRSRRARPADRGPVASSVPRMQPPGPTSRWLAETIGRGRRQQRILAVNLPIPAGTYGIDTMHTQLGFSVTHLGISLVRGTFDRFSGWLTVGDSLADTTVTIEAEMASMNSGNPMRDEHMHGTDFFDVANHPQMIFQSTSITESGSGYALTGNLTIKGVSHPVTLDTTFNGSGCSRWINPPTTASARARRSAGARSA